MNRRQFLGGLLSLPLLPLFAKRSETRAPVEAESSPVREAVDKKFCGVYASYADGGYADGSTYKMEAFVAGEWVDLGQAICHEGKWSFTYPADAERVRWVRKRGVS